MIAILQAQVARFPIDIGAATAVLSLVITVVGYYLRQLIQNGNLRIAAAFNHQLQEVASATTAQTAELKKSFTEAQLETVRSIGEVVKNTAVGDERMRALEHRVTGMEGLGHRLAVLEATLLSHGSRP